MGVVFLNDLLVDSHIVQYLNASLDQSVTADLVTGEALLL